LPFRDFEPPAGIVYVTVCLESGELATEHCTKTRLEVFREEREPTSPCQLHSGNQNRRQDDQGRVHF
jgi:membrane carboxypeptidase/penicillin-binding protein